MAAAYCQMAALTASSPTTVGKRTAEPLSASAHGGGGGGGGPSTGTVIGGRPGICTTV
jgi:hypothetical protein